MGEEIFQEGVGMSSTCMESAADATGRGRTQRDVRMQEKYWGIEEKEDEGRPHKRVGMNEFTH